MIKCPCNSNKLYRDCCSQFIEAGKTPATPGELMRSRYTAYTKANIEYIVKTMRSPASDDFNFHNAKNWAQSIEWIRLEVIRESMTDERGYVEFIAYYSLSNEILSMHEISEFHRIAGQWYYVDGKSLETKQNQANRLGRNDLCLCNSGKKYKKCCLLK